LPSTWLWDSSVIETASNWRLKRISITCLLTMASAFFVSIQQTARSIATRASLVSSNTALRSVAGARVAWRDACCHQSLASNDVLRTYTTSSAIQKKAWDPSLEQYKYWNREESKKGEGESCCCCNCSYVFSNQHPH
jgi:hypothetical protein